ncbi:MAG: DinB family protein [Gemmatimonadota bacterium]
MRLIGFLLLFAVVATPASAQDTAQVGQTDPVIASIRNMYEPTKRFITLAAEQMPEEHYTFRPTEEVRSFGELIGHIADAHYMMCAAGMKWQNPQPQVERNIHTKAALVEALEASFTFCDRAYSGARDAMAGETIQFMGSEQSRFYPLTFNIVHDNEHYGNIVTYMRMKGLVPPSSQVGGG